MYEYQLNFQLSAQQVQASQALLHHYKNKQNTIINAVCGAGKTEMLLEVLKYALNKGHQIGLACPRKALLGDLYKRISEYFNHHFSIITGDLRKDFGTNLTFLTCHQLKSYPQYFDLLIIDEVDAFPFVDNYQLESDALQASRYFIYLSATLPLKYYKLAQENNYHLINIFTRYHAKPIPVPKIKVVKQGFMIIKTLLIAHHSLKPLLIYVPSIKQGQQLYKIMRLLFKKVIFTYAKNTNHKLLQQIKNNEYNIIISTMVLERGITIEQVNVIVFNANHPVYSNASLIQISGRVGRSALYHQGTIIYLCYQRETKLQMSIDLIIESNEQSNEMSHL